MNENLQKLYDVLVRDGYYTKSYDEFQTKWNDEGYRKKVYGAVSRDGLYTKDYDSFASKYSITEPVEETPTVKKKDATASPSDGGSSVYQKISGGKTTISEGLAGKYKKPEPLFKGAMETSLSGVGGVPAEMYANQSMPSLDEEQRRELIETASEDENSKAILNRSINQWVKEQVESDAFGRSEDYFRKLIDTQPYLKEKALREATASPQEKKKKQLEGAVKDELLKSGVDYTFVSKLSPEEIDNFIGGDDILDWTGNTGKEWAWMSHDKGESIQGDPFSLMGYNFVEAAVVNPNGSGYKYGPQGTDEKYRGAEVGERISPNVPSYAKPAVSDIVIGENIKYAAENGRANKWFADRTTDIKKWNEAIAKQWEQYHEAVDQHNNYASYPNTETARKVEADLKAQRVELLKKQRFIDYSSERLSNLMTGFNDVYNREYIKKKEQEGGVTSATFKSFYDGLVGMSKGAVSVGLDVMTTIPAFSDIAIADPDAYEIDRTESDIQKAKSSAVKRELINMFDKASESISGVSDEYINSSDRSKLQQGWNAAVNSIGTAISGGGAGNLSKAAFFAMSYNQFDKELSGEEFDGLSTAQKMAVSGTYGMVVSYLERVGFQTSTRALKNFKGIDRFISETLDMVPRGASPEVIQRAIDNNLAAKIATGVLKIEAGAIVETATEDAQKLGEIGIKHLVNKLNDYEYFKNIPSTLEEIVSDVWEETQVAFIAAQVFGIGGGAVSSVRDGISNKTSDLEFEVQTDILMDDQLRSQAFQAIGKRIASGEITKEEGEAQINSIKEMYAVIQSMPEELTTRQKRESFNLITERNRLEKEVEGKDKSLVDDKLQRIKDINEELKLIGRGDAVQEQAEVSEVSQEVAEGKPAAEPEVVTEEGKKEVVSGVEITYPTEQQKEERIAERTNPAYVEESANKLQEEDVDVLSKELDGEFGLLTAENPMAQPLTEQENTLLNEKAIEWLENRGYKPRRVTGKYGQAENSFFVPGLTRDDAIAFAKEFNQESVAHSDGLVYQDGSINPRVKEQDDFSFGKYSPDSDYVSVIKTKDGLRTFSVGYNFDEKISQQPTANQITIDNEAEFINQADEKHVKTVKAAGRAVKALNKLGVKVFLHDTQDSYQEAISQRTGVTKKELASQEVGKRRSAGSFLSSNEIHIDLSNPNTDAKTVFHEAFHAVVMAKGIDSKAIKKFVADVKKSAKLPAEMVERLDEFANQYEAGEINEEFLSELVGELASRAETMSPTGLQRLINAINKLFSAIGMPRVLRDNASRQETIDFLNGVSQSFSQGKDVGAVTSPTIVDKVNRKMQIAPGNKLFNEPLEDAKRIADKYMTDNNMEIVDVDKINKVDEARAKRISDEYEKMANNPTDPEVAEAYEAMSNETLAQYNYIVAEGYVVEINNSEPYSSSGDMIQDLRDNKRMKIFSTESGFGDEPITEAQRKENVLLRDSGKKDVNGQTLLVNDVFRFVHDFFGHAKLGNGFGPIGEENAWRVHSVMYTDKARRAMTSETRGQNSWVNFSGVNEEVFKKRDKARELRKEGKTEEADKLVGEVYDEMSFAEQKNGLMPEWTATEGAPISRKKQISGDGKKDNKRIETVNKAKNSYDKAKETGKNDQDAYDTAITALENSTWYSSANDIQREVAVRQLRKQIGIKETSAPSVAKILGKPKDKKITVNERVVLAEKLKAIASAERAGRLSEKKARQRIAEELSVMFKGLKGKVNAPKMAAVVKKALSMNLSTPLMEQRFFDYVNKVIKDVEHADKLDQAYKLRKTIKRLSKNQQLGLSTMARTFASFDPAITDDIDRYIGIAKRVEGALKATRLSGMDLLFRDKVNIAGVTSYAMEQLRKQEQIQKDMIELRYPELFEAGIIDRNDSIAMMRAKIEEMKESDLLEVMSESEIREEVAYKIEGDLEALKELLETGFNPYTMQNAELSQQDREAIEKMLELDPNTLTIKELFTYSDMITNIANNIDTGNLDAFVREINGTQNAYEFLKKAGKAQIRTALGRMYVNQFGQLDLLMENVFASTNAALEFMSLSGLSEVSEQAIRSQVEVARFVDEYMSKYMGRGIKKGKKPNGKKFADAYNIYERGMYAFLIRNKGGDVVAVQKEFERRLGLIKQSIDYLKNSKDKQEAKKGKVYEEVAKKLGLYEDGITALDIESRTDVINRSAVSWWIDKWGEYYVDMASTAKLVYNKELSSDVNYTSDRLKKRAGLYEKEALEGAYSGMMYGPQGTSIFADESGALMDTKNPVRLPSDRFVDLDFDMNQAKMIEEAIIDSRTAAAIRQVKGFTSSKAFSDMFKNVGTKTLIENRITDYINSKRKKNFGQIEDLDGLKQFTNIAAKTGAVLALASVGQTFKQTLPIAVSTVLNSGFNSPYIKSSFDSEYIKWLEDNGSDLAMRGLESDIAVHRAEKNLEKSQELGRKVAAAANGLSDVYLSAFLKHPDVYIARASFLAYYKQGLKRQGLKADVDFSKPMNKKAARYANAMVNRMQNVSDPDKAGKFWTNKSFGVDFLRKTAFTFANFVMNQKVRTITDIKKISTPKNYKSSSPESLNSVQDVKDAWRSLASTGLEMTSYYALSALIRMLYRMYSDSVVGGDEAEEDEAITRLVKQENENRIARGEAAMIPGSQEERNFRAGLGDSDLSKKIGELRWEKEWKTAATAASKDFLSPIPATDVPTVKFLNYLLRETSRDDLKKEIDEAIETYANMAGMRGEDLTDLERQRIEDQIVEENSFQLWDFNDDSYAKQYGTIGIGMDKYSEYFEAKSMADNGAFENKKGELMFLMDEDVEFAKDNVFMYGAYMYALLPADVGSIARYNSNRLKERALTLDQYVDYKTYNAIIDDLNKKSDKQIERITRDEWIMVSRGTGSFEDVLKNTRKDWSDEYIRIKVAKKLGETDIKLDPKVLELNIKKNLNKTNQMIERNK